MKIHKETHDVNRQGSKLRDFEGLWTDFGGLLKDVCSKTYVYEEFRGRPKLKI